MEEPTSWEIRKAANRAKESHDQAKRVLVELLLRLRAAHDYIDSLEEQGLWAENE